MENNSEKDNRDEVLKKIKDEVVDLKESPLYEIRIKNGVFPVIGEGSHYAKIMFIGEAPGKNESETGRPFCGAAGRVLTEMIVSIGMDRKDVYITNIVKDRPPDNRDPFPDEIAIYSPFLDRQIEAIKPDIIATLGRYSMAYIMKRFGLEDKLTTISRMHGEIFEVKADYGNIKIIPLYHPAVALYQGSLRKDLFKDFEIIKNSIHES